MNMASVRTEMVRLLSLEGAADATLLGRLDVIIGGVVQALSLRLGGADVPDSLSYIVRDVSLARYNRIGSEGAASHNVEGESISYAGVDDFAPFARDIELWVEANAAARVRKVHFL